MQSVDATPLQHAAARVGLPLTLLDVGGESAPAAYRHRLLLSRPDQHVAWRGNVLPADAGALIERIRGSVARGKRDG